MLGNCSCCVVCWITIKIKVSKYDPRFEIFNNVVYATSKASDQPAHMRSLIRAFASRLNILSVLSYWPNSIWAHMIEPRHELYNNVVYATSKASDQPAYMRSLIRAFASCLNILWLSSYWPNSIKIVEIILKTKLKKEAAQAHLSLHLSKYHIVGNHMSRLNYTFQEYHQNLLLVLIRLQTVCKGKQQTTKVVIDG